MSKIKLLTIAVIGLLLINLGMVGYLMFKDPIVKPGSQNGRPPRNEEGPMKNEGPKQLIIDRLHFDEEQTAQYEILIKEHQVIIKSLSDSIREAKNELYQTLTNENATEKDAVIADLGILQRRIELTHYGHFMDIKKLCKPNQLKNFEALANDLAGFFAPDKKGPPPPPRRN